MTQIQSMMAKNLITIPSGSTVASAQDIFREKRIRHLPVVNQEGHITGLLQSQNLPLSQELKSLPADLFMSSEIFLISDQSTIKEAVYKVLENKTSSLLVHNDSREVVGIITTDDLLFHLTQFLSSEEPTSRTWKQWMDIPTLGQVIHQLSMSGL